LFVAAFVIMLACSGTKLTSAFVIENSKSYEASLFRQNCAICHGREAEGKTLSDGRVIPNLRAKPYKYPAAQDIHRHIAEGGNGMIPFRNILSDREINLLVEFVRRDLRGE
jgi:mono/diheme cytochrome c family protein